MTNTSGEVQVLAAVWPLRGNRTLAELVQRNIAWVGMPSWTDDEQRFAINSKPTQERNRKG